VNDGTILETVHGSRLYGLGRSTSDHDLFRVVPTGRTRQRVTGEDDVTVMGLDVFLGHVFAGSHQSCEALFSPLAEIDPRYLPLFRGLRVTGADAFARYRRTIHSFSYGDTKKRRHAVRLGYNLADLRREGRFNPVLTPGQHDMVVLLAELYSGQSLYDIASNL
jgi:hypothetical protein